MCSTTRWSEPTPPAEAPITTISKFATSLVLQDAGRGQAVKIPVLVWTVRPMRDGKSAPEFERLLTHLKNTRGFD